MAPAPIIFCRTGALGDFVLGLPLLLHLAAPDPRRILLVARGGHRALLPAPLAGSAFLDCDAPAAAPLFSVTAAPPSPPLARRLRDAELFLFQRPDAPLAEALRRHGAARVCWIEPRPHGPLHAAASFLRAAGCLVPRQLPHTTLWPEARPRGRALWVHPGSGSVRKNWPPALFAGLARTWQDATRQPVLVSAGEADTSIMPHVQETFAAAGVPFAWRTGLTLAELHAHLRQEAAVVLGNDSGVCHLAAASGIPTVALFRCTDPAVWRPLGPCDPVSAADVEYACTDPAARTRLARRLLAADGRSVSL